MEREAVESCGAGGVNRMSAELEMTTPIEEIEAYVEEEIQKRVGLVIDAFKRIGEECISVARVKVQAIPKDYTDRSGHLRSSVGYAILDNGVLVQEPTVVDALDADGEGERRAKEYIKKLQSEYNEGLVLIVVAGMDYAAYVQAKGYDVLVSADMKMEEMVERMTATFTDAGIL